MLAMIAHCGPSFASDVLHQIERLAATADACDTIGVVGSVASCVIRIPGSIPHLHFTPEITSFIAVVRSDRADVGPLQVAVDAGFSDARVREMLIERYLRAVALIYLRHFPVSTLYGTMKHAIARERRLISLKRPIIRHKERSSIKKQICKAILAQCFILPIVETPK
jgi:hypothetical protein